MKLAAGALAASIVVLSWVFGGGPAGLLYLVVYLLAVAPGLPVGFASSDEGTPRPGCAARLIGYGITQLALWAVIVTGFASPIAFMAAWLIVRLAQLGALVQASRWADPGLSRGLRPTPARYSWSCSSSRR